MGKGEGTFLLDELKCHGDEASILDCEFNPWGEHDCQDNEWAGVSCKTQPGSHQIDSATEKYDSGFFLV